MDAVAALGRRLFQTKVAGIGILTGDRVRIFHAGSFQDDLPSAASLSARVVANGRPIAMANIAHDVAYSDLPYVRGSPNLRSFLGVPLRSRDGMYAGAVIIADDRPREFCGDDVATAILLTRIVEEVLATNRVRAGLATLEAAAEDHRAASLRMEWALRILTVKPEETPCAISVEASVTGKSDVLEVVGRKWTVQILRALDAADNLRFSALQSAVTGISARTLSARVRTLVALGLVHRRELAGPTLRVEYSLTAAGRQALRATRAM